MIRHHLANLIYRVAARLDGQTGRIVPWGGMLTYGSERQSSGVETPSVQVHTVSETVVSADFQPGDYTYAALHIGGVTVFLRRRSVWQIITVLKEVAAAYDKYGEGRHS